MCTFMWVTMHGTMIFRNCCVGASAIKALEDLTRFFFHFSLELLKITYLYVSSNDKVPNDNNDPPELLELLLSKHWRMSDWSKAVIKVETSLPVEFLTIFLDSHFLALLAQMFEEAELKPIHCWIKSFFIMINIF